MKKTIDIRQTPAKSKKLQEDINELAAFVSKFSELWPLLREEKRSKLRSAYPLLDSLLKTIVEPLSKSVDMER